MKNKIKQFSKEKLKASRWMSKKLLQFILLFIIILSGCAKEYEVVDGDPPIKQPFNHQVIFNYDYDISGMNDTLYDTNYTVDVVLFYSDHLNMTWSQLKAEFLTADVAFRKVGVQLNLKKAVNVSFPAEWNNQLAWYIPSLPDYGQTVGFYDEYFITKSTLTKNIKEAFTDFVVDEENNERTVFIVPMSGMKILYTEQKPNGAWQIGGPVATGALSFPGYILQDRISKNLRGIITMESASGVTLAHELGHKLINVSHEGLSVSPAFSGNTIPGLMGYGTSTAIYGGQAGRWHQERLLLSPFLYKTVNGYKVYNPEYENVGAYNDPIYGSFVMPQ